MFRGVCLLLGNFICQGSKLPFFPILGYDHQANSVGAYIRIKKKKLIKGGDENEEYLVCGPHDASDHQDVCRFQLKPSWLP